MKPAKKVGADAVATIPRSILDKVVSKQLSASGLHAYCWLRILGEPDAGIAYEFKSKVIPEKIFMEHMQLSRSRAYGLVRELRNVGLLTLG